MIRFFTNNLLRFAAAVVLLVMSLCAVEVGFRTQKLRQKWRPESALTDSASRYVEPSRTTYLDVPPHVQHTSAGLETALVVTNAWGLRGKEVLVPKPRGVYRVLCLGNEETLAVDLEEEATYVNTLQATLQTSSTLPIEALNGGCPGAGPIVHLLRGRRLLGLQPDLILMVLSPSDIQRDTDVRRFLRLDEEGLPSYACHPTLRQGDSIVDEICQEFCTVEWLAQSASSQFLKVPNSTASSTSSQGESDQLPPEFDQRLLEMPFVQTAVMADRIYARYAIIVVPTPWDLAAEKSRQQSDRRNPRTMLQQVSVKHGLPLCDLMADFQSHPQVRSLYSAETGRLSAMGHAFVAERVSRYLINNIPGAWGSSPGEQSRPVPEIGQWP